MQLIEKIEIKSFRSFGNQKKNKTQIFDLKDLNIFSGGNDSGKSNILRALNLFFNQKTNLNNFIDFDKDFFKPKKGYENNFIAEEMITIKIFFWNKKNAGFNKNSKKSAKLPERFWVSRKWTKNSTYTNFNQDHGVYKELEREKGENWKDFSDSQGKILPNIRANIAKQLTDFLNSIQYHYVPAIKDKEYFAHLYGELQKTLLKEHQSEVTKTKNNFENALQKSTEELMLEFNNVVNSKTYDISAAFELPDLINLFQTLNVQTGNNISLTYRGDGIQAKLIPEILYFISVKEKQFKQTNIIKGEKVKKYFIWGFEEPENSYEYKNVRLLADRFLEVFSRNAQIFITTHSKEFLSLQPKLTDKEVSILNNTKFKKTEKLQKIQKLVDKDRSSEISLYRVWKNENTYNASQIVRFNNSKNEWDNIEKDLGLDDSFIIQESRMVEQLQKEIQKQKEKIVLSDISNEKKEQVIKMLQNNIEELTSKLMEAEDIIKQFEKICVYFEDEYLSIYKIAYLKLKNIPCDENNYEKLFEEHAPYLFFGKAGKQELYKCLDPSKIPEHECRKIVGVFDFDEAYSDFNGLHKDRWGIIEGTEQTGLYRKRKDNESFYAMLLPVPAHRLSYASKIIGDDSRLEVELFFEDEILKQLNVWGEKIIPRTNPIQKETIFTGKKSSFGQMLFSLERNAFLAFEALFDRIDNLFLQI
ncbi:AAA family ATPase [bacterium]|nr:AAA family ATPase [bacterium]